MIRYRSKEAERNNLINDTMDELAEARRKREVQDLLRFKPKKGLITQ